jgi:hypothetical protein
MYKKIRTAFLLGMLIVLFPLSLIAQEHDQRDYEIALTKGQYAIELGDLASAIAYLNKALTYKPGDQAARVSLGIAYARSGDLVRAKEVLEQAVGADAKDARARYELAGVLDQLGQQDQAKRQMAAAAEAAKDPALRSAAQGFLQAAVAEEAPDRPSLRIAGALQYDSNVILSPDNPVTPAQGKQSDWGGVLILDGRYPFLTTAARGLEAGYQFYQNLHSDLSDFNVQQHDLSMEGHLSLSAAALFDLRYDFRYTSLGGDHYSTSHIITPMLSLKLSPGSLTHLHGVYEAKRFFASPLYAALPEKNGSNTAAGVTHAVAAGGRSSVAFDYTYDQDRTTVSYWDYSGQNVLVNALSDWEGFRFFFSAAYRDRKYNGVPPGAAIERHDRIQEYSAGVSRTVRGSVPLSLSDLYTINGSNILFYEYTRNIIGIFAEIRL